MWDRRRCAQLEVGYHLEGRVAHVREPRTAAIPVAAFTASVITTDRSRITAAGFDAFIGKPVRMKEFLATVNCLCE